MDSVSVVALGDTTQSPPRLRWPVSVSSLFTVCNSQFGWLLGYGGLKITSALVRAPVFAFEFVNNAPVL